MTRVSHTGVKDHLKTQNHGSTLVTRFYRVKETGNYSTRFARGTARIRDNSQDNGATESLMLNWGKNREASLDRDLKGK